MSRNLFRACAFVLPLAGLVWLWVSTDVMSKKGTVWEIGVSGYDPLDFLRGHYVRYQYDWPNIEGVAAPDKWETRQYIPERFCLTGNAPAISGAFVELNEPGKPKRLCDQLVRAPTSGESVSEGLNGGIIYVPEAKAASMEEKLRDRSLRATLRMRIREDGLIRPIDLTFRRKTKAELDADKAREEAERLRLDGATD